MDVLCVGIAHIGGGPDAHPGGEYRTSTVKNADGDYTITLTDPVLLPTHVYPTATVVDTTGGAQATCAMNYLGNNVWQALIKRGAALIDDAHVHIVFLDFTPFVVT
jgi:hypothetical protein